MKIIKNAFVYRISLPAVALLQDHLASMQHRPILETEGYAAGFVLLHGEQVLPFAGGFAFALQYDEKLLPASVINEEAKRRVAAQELVTGYKLAKPERQAIKEQVVVDLLRVSHVRSKTITAFYHVESQLLFVNTSSKHMAAVLTSRLVQAVGSAKTTTINISDVKGGLTTRLADYLANFGQSEAFGEFDLHPEVWLKGETGKVTYQISELGDGDKGLIEALNTGMRVEAVRLGYGPVSFKLTGDFAFKAVRFEDAEPADHDDVVAEYTHECAVEVFAFVQALEALCTLFDYKAPAEEAAE